MMKFCCRLFNPPFAARPTMPYRFPITFESLHPVELCFFCKRQPASTNENIDLYKTVQNKEGFPGYVAKYATATIRIPICKECDDSHRASKASADKLWRFCYAIGVVIVTWSIHAEGEGWLIAIVGGVVLGFPVGGLVGFAILAVWALCSFSWFVIKYMFGKIPDDEAHDSAKNFPLYKALAERGWRDTQPKPKSDRRLHEEVPPETLAKIHRETIEEARDISEEYDNAVRKHFKT